MNVKCQTKPIRSIRGFSSISLVLVLAVFVLTPLGLLAFEVGRANLAREQLRSCCESAAIAGAATLAVSDNPDTAATHNSALLAASLVFKKNYVLSKKQTDAVTVGDVNSYNPNETMTGVQMEFIDPLTRSVVSSGDPRGKVMRVTAKNGLVPAFSQFLRIFKTPIVATASAGVPQLDVVLCFDVSGSIDDQTPVSFVKRHWDGTAGKITYRLADTRAGSPITPSAQGSLYDIVGPPATGSAVNATYPQRLSISNQSDHRWKLYFSEESGNGTHTARGLRGASNTGAAPGNHPSLGSGAGIGSNNTYTDLVVNIDGRASFGGITEGGYSFPDLATVVEAARGNLENDTVFRNSLANSSVTVTPREGYQAKYFELASRNVQPLKAAQDAAQLFYSILRQDADSHFGLVAFSDNGGTSSASSVSYSKVDDSYSAGGTGSFPLPAVPISSAPGVTNYSEVVNAVYSTTATGGTNIGDAIVKGISQLRNGRTGSKKAIVVFTDGQPTAGGPLSNNAWTNARLAAREARREGIPIFTIGLAQNPEIITGEKAILNDWNNSDADGGVAAIAGNGGRFFLVTNSQNLRYTFENLARQLVQLVRNN